MANITATKTVFNFEKYSNLISCGWACGQEHFRQSKSNFIWEIVGEARTRRTFAVPVRSTRGNFVFHAEVPI